MKIILLHFLVSWLVTYIGSVILMIGIIGIINLRRRKPFLDRWRQSLSEVSFVLIVLSLADLIPPHLRLTATLSAVALLFGIMIVLLFGVIIWFRIKYPNHFSQQRTVVWKRGKSGGDER